MHVVGTSLWVDARRAQHICFATSADKVGRAGHGQLIATPETLAQLDSSANALPAPLRRAFTLGTLSLEAFPTGHAVGGAGVLVGGRIAIVGGFLDAPAIGTAGELRASERLVLEIAVSDGRDVPPVREAADAAAAWLREAGEAVVMVRTIGRALDVALALEARGVAVAGSAALQQVAERLRAQHLLAPALAGDSIWIGSVADARRQRRRSAPRLWLSHRTEDGAALGAAHAIAWASGLAHNALVRTLRQLRAKHVWLTGPGAQTFAPRIGARVLLPPRQMQLAL